MIVRIELDLSKVDSDVLLADVAELLRKCGAVLVRGLGPRKVIEAPREEEKRES